MVVDVTFSEIFERKFRKFKEDSKIKIRKQINKILDNPEVGKPMRHNRKGTREVYVGSFRLSYAYLVEDDKIILLDFYVGISENRPIYGAVNPEHPKNERRTKSTLKRGVAHRFSDHKDEQ